MKIDREKMRQIGEAVEAREEMRQVIRASYSNDALAQRFGVNVRTIEKLAALHRPAAELRTVAMLKGSALCKMCVRRAK